MSDALVVFPASKVTSVIFKPHSKDAFLELSLDGWC